MRQPTRSIVSLAHLWRRQGWLIIAILWLIAVALGLIGFADNAPAMHRSPRLPDIAYRTLQLIPINSGDVDGATWPLDVARFLIPFLAAWTAIRAFLGFFRDRWQQALVRVWRDHVIICGLSRKGWLLAQGFAARGRRVVVIEADESHDLIGPCRDRGIPVFTGDATDPDLLRRAGAPRARHLVAVTDSDGINAEISVRCHSLLAAGPRTRADALTCTVHLVDPELYELARTRELALEADAPLRLELFNVFERGARILWRDYGPASAEGDAACSFHALLIGLGNLGESLVVSAGRDWHSRLHERPCRAAGRLRFTVLDEDAERKCRALHARYPQLANTCDLVPHTMRVGWPEFYAASFLGGGASDPPVAAVFVCFDDDSLGLRTALTVRQQLINRGACDVPVVVRMAESSGLARLIEPAREGAFAGLHAFPLLDRTCTPEAILGGSHELLARSLHDERLPAQGDRDAARRRWEDLSDDARRFELGRADQLGAWLRGAGCAVAPLRDWDAAHFEFTAAEIDRLARLRHEQYVQEMAAAGRAAGPAEPPLVPYDQLTAAEREAYARFVRGAPAFFARAGFQIVRLSLKGNYQ